MKEESGRAGSWPKGFRKEVNSLSNLCGVLLFEVSG